MLYCLIYASESAPQWSRSLKEILTVSQHNNAAAELTGALCMAQRTFLQCLEGQREAVNALYHRIATDKRHSSPIILHGGELAQRRFSAWSMGLVIPNPAQQDMFRRYAPSGTFDKSTLTSDEANRFFDEVARQPAWLFNAEPG